MQSAGRAGASLASFLFLPFSTDGLGLRRKPAKSDPGLRNAPRVGDRRHQWFDAQWSALGANPAVKATSSSCCVPSGATRDPLALRVIRITCSAPRGRSRRRTGCARSATGISRTTEYGRRLFKFQRDGVVGAIDKLASFRRMHHRLQRRPRRTFEHWPSSVSRNCVPTVFLVLAPNGCATTGAFIGKRPSKYPAGGPVFQLTTFSPHRSVGATVACRRHRPRSL